MENGGFKLESGLLYIVMFRNYQSMIECIHLYSSQIWAL